VPGLYANADARFLSWRLFNLEDATREDVQASAAFRSVHMSAGRLLAVIIHDSPHMHYVSRDHATGTDEKRFCLPLDRAGFQ
jgi:hypothetical protein